MVLVIHILIKKSSDIINLYGPFDTIFVGHAWLNDGKIKKLILK